MIVVVFPSRRCTSLLLKASFFLQSLQPSSLIRYGSSFHLSSRFFLISPIVYSRSHLYYFFLFFYHHLFFSFFPFPFFSDVLRMFHCIVYCSLIYGFYFIFDIFIVFFCFSSFRFCPSGLLICFSVFLWSQKILGVVVCGVFITIH